MVKKVGPYELRTILGKGTFGTVYLGKHTPTNDKIAVKVISKESLKPELLSRLEQEIQCQKSVNSENIVKLLDVQKTENNFYLVLEYCEGGDLGSFIKKQGPVSEKVAQKWTQQIIEGFKALNKKNIIHRDLKLQNILMTENSINAVLKLADFGLSRFLEDDLAKTWVGTPLYMAPEIINLQEYDAKADIWSLGLVLFELLTGELPIKVQKREQIPHAQRNLKSFPETISAECRDLLGRLLEYNPKTRISFQELFVHPFVIGEKPKVSEELQDKQSDTDEDFILLEGDESVHEGIVSMKNDTHPMINIGEIIGRLNKELEIFAIFWKVGEKLEKRYEVLSAFAIFVLSGEMIEQCIIGFQDIEKKHDLAPLNFPRLFEKYEEMKQALRRLLRKTEEMNGALLGKISGKRICIEQVLMDYALKLCADTADCEYLNNDALNKLSFKEAILILEYINDRYCPDSQPCKKRLTKFISETYSISNFCKA